MKYTMKIDIINFINMIKGYKSIAYLLIKSTALKLCNQKLNINTYISKTKNMYINIKGVTIGLFSIHVFGNIVSRL